MTLEDHNGIITSVKFNPESNCISSTGSEGTIKIWDIRSKKILQHYNAHSDTVNEISFHPSGFYCLSASNDSKVKVWDLRQGKLSYTLFGHNG